MKLYDTGIYGLWFGHNYGSILTYFALAQTLSKNGHRCAMIENPLRTEDDVSSLRRSHPIKFARTHQNIAPLFRPDEMTKLNDLFDRFVIGSDQMWNYALSKPYGQSYFLDFANDDKKKYSYAVSFGQEIYNGPEEEIAPTAANLKRFDGISVRDGFSKKILQDTFGVSSSVVADPVFLCPRERYDGLIAEVRDLPIDLGEDYIFAYILDPNLVVGDNLSRIADELDIPVYVCFNESGDKMEFMRALGLRSKRVVCLEDPTVQEWLCLLKNSKAVLTDSFHGSCFSIIYNKPFVVKKNKKRGGLRFDQLLGSFGLTDCMIDNPCFFYEKVTSMEKLSDIQYNKDIELIRFSRDWIGRI